MNELDELKKLYESTEIPAELSQRIDQALSQQESRQKGHNLEKIKGDYKMNETNQTTNNAGKNRKRLYRSLSAGVAAFAVLTGAFAYGVSTNEAFASSMSDVPILGNLVRVFTGEQVDEMDNVAHIEMNLPKVEGLTDKTVEDRINKEIHDKMTAVVEEAKARAIENKKAWLDTGGKEADYNVFDIIVDYEVKTISDDVLSFLVNKTETTASAYFEQYYYNIDLATNKELTLKDLLGDNYKELANKQIAEEIAVRSQNPENMYFDGSDGVDGFHSISDTQNFYVNTQGNPVIVFNKYEIAPGYMGIQEFEITK